MADTAVWPRTTIATSAVEFALGGEEMLRRSRKPEIMADAAHAILVRDASEYTGNFALDEDILRDEGVTDYSSYRFDSDTELAMDIFVAPD